MTLRNIPGDLLVTELPSAVTVRLRGPKALESAALESTAAVIDLGQAGPGICYWLFPTGSSSMISRAMVGLSGGVLSSHAGQIGL